jgi:hypothetical protein
MKFAWRVDVCDRVVVIFLHDKASLFLLRGYCEPWSILVHDTRLDRKAVTVELRNEKWLRDMHRELSTIDLVSTCPPDPAQAGWKGGGKVAGIKLC